MSATSFDRLKWYECVIDLLSCSDAIADRDEDGKAIYYLFGWTGTVELIDEQGRSEEVTAELGSVRMDGFSVTSKAVIPAGSTVIASIESSPGIEQQFYARVLRAEHATRHSKSVNCVVTNQPDQVRDDAFRLRITQNFK